MTETKSTLMFRNAGKRIFYLKPRPGESKDFLFGPGMTIEPMDEAEARMLATISMDIRDVAKEAPIVGSVIQDLQQKVAEEREINAKLQAENKALKAQAEASGRVGEEVAAVPVSRKRKK